MSKIHSSVHKPVQTFANTGDPIAAETVKRRFNQLQLKLAKTFRPQKNVFFKAQRQCPMEGYPSTELQTVVDPTGMQSIRPRLWGCCTYQL
jgi:hypothetical protein